MDEKLGISVEELGCVVEEMMTWLKSPEGDLQVEVTVDQTVVPFFRERDLQHLADIAGMVHHGRIACAVLCPSIAAGVFFLIRKGRKKTLGRAYLFSWGFLLLAAMGIGLWLLVDPVGLIDTFHRIFFRNELWILNPVTDKLIWLFPVPLFQDGAIRLGIALAAVHTLALSFAVWALVGKKANESVTGNQQKAGETQKTQKTGK